ncbi:MAG: hypothetical protein EBZ77_10360 [Chitinophagia bacterium]|nr:hypothetical protein [Chitinophagia bacterium]
MSVSSVVFMGSKPIGYECLKYLIAQQDSLRIKVTGVLTQARSEFGGEHDLAQLAAQNSIPVYPSPDDIPECDLIYSVQYHLLLNAAQIAIARVIAVNLHMAPLPEYRGSNQFSFAILDGKREFGTTIHQMTTGMDSGAILFQKRFPIAPDVWVNDLYRQTFAASLNLFRQTLAHIIAGKYTLLPQESLVPAYGTTKHYRNEMKAIKQIDLSWDIEKIERHIRATSMPGFEPPFCIIDGKKVLFTVKEA